MILSLELQTVDQLARFGFLSYCPAGEQFKTILGHVVPL